jgi:hypothetical protein
MNPSSPSPIPLVGKAQSGLPELLLLAHAWLILAVSPRKGAESIPIVLFQVGCACAALFTLLRAHRTDAAPVSISGWQPRAGMALFLSSLLFFIFGNTGYGEHRFELIPFRLLCVPFLGFYLLAHEPPKGSILRPLYGARRSIFWMLVGAAGALRIAAMYISPSPEIDVFWFTNQGAEGLLQGINPYSREFHVIDPQSRYLYAYLPGQFLLDVPSVALLGNMRWGQILAEGVAALLFYRLVRGTSLRVDDARRHSAELLTLLLLYFPQTLRMQEQSWVEFKQVFAMTLFVYLLSRRPSGAAAWGALGFLFVLKPTTWASGPFLLRLRSFGLRPALVVGAVMLAVVAPFLLWDAPALYDDVIRYQASFGLSRSTSILWAITLITGWNVEPLNLWVALVGGATFLTLLWQRRPGLVSFLLASAILGMVPVLMRQAFLNYYYYLDALLLLALAWVVRQQHDRDEGLAEVRL